MTKELNRALLSNRSDRLRHERQAHCWLVLRRAEVAYAIACVPHAALWAAITGSLALVPFLGYVAVAALSLQLAMKGAAAPALLSWMLGSLILFGGDKIVRPVVAANGTHLPFVWVLMGCLGGFEVLGLVGLVVGPVALTLARELWKQRVSELALPSAIDSPSSVDNDVRAQPVRHAK